MNIHSLVARLRRPENRIRSFAHDLAEGGGVLGAIDRGFHAVETQKIVGSVDRWRTLRADFSYRDGGMSGQRFARVIDAMNTGKSLPPLELYKIGGSESRYYVIDGHHRVAVARKFGQAALDAHVVEYRIGRSPPCS